MNTSYSIPLAEIRCEHIVVNSKFIASLSPVFNVEQAREFVSRIRKEFPDASHNVPAYIIGGGNTVVEFCSDDGEPAGTSGKPALAVLRGSGLGDVVVVVTRYFGGTLLGTGGLVKAYTESTQMVVNVVQRGRKISVHVVMVAIPYSFLGRVRLMAKRNGGDVLDEGFTEDVVVTLQFPVDLLANFQAELQELSAGKINVELIETKEIVVALESA